MNIYLFIICFILSASPASECYMPTFRNTLCSIFRGDSEDRTECSETSVYKIQTPGNHPEESIQHSEHSESLKSRKYVFLFYEREIILFIKLADFLHKLCRITGVSAGAR